MKEDEIHIQIVEYWELCKPFGAFVHHSPNESWKAKVAWRMKQKRMGVRHGFPDLRFFCPMPAWKWANHYARLLLEVKTPKGRISENQQQCLAELKAADCHVAIVRSLKDAEDVLHKFMEMRDVRT